MKKLPVKSIVAMSLVGIIIVLLTVKMYPEEKVSGKIPIAYQPGVVFTFDDDYIDDWYVAEKLLHQYGWRATFFICKYAAFTANQKQKLHHLQDMGHDIVGHGYNHLNALKYSIEFGLDKYINDEILPLKEVMAKDGFNIHSFAYPDGAHNNALDNELLKYFQIIRGTTYNAIPPQSQYCYYEGKRLIYGLGIDDDYKQFNVEYYKSLIDYAKAHDKIVIFYGHKTVANADEKLETPLSALEDLCKYVKHKGLKFYTVDDLSKL